MLKQNSAKERANASDDLKQQRIAYSLNERCRQYFFPNGIDAEIDGAQAIDVPAQDWEEQLQTLRPTVLLTSWSTPPLPSTWLEQEDCPLRYVSHVTGSVRGIVPRSFIERGGLISNWGAMCAPQVAEYALLLALGALRSLPQWPAYIQQPPRQRRLTQLGTHTLFGKRVSIHGFGRVARTLVQLLRPFSVEIRAFSEGVPHELMHEEGVAPCQSLKELCQSCDVFFGCEALTELSRGSLTAERLATIPDGSIFVNVGRGAIVDEDALLKEASSGRLRIATDVCITEPMACGSPLATTPGLLATPHIAGPTADQLTLLGQHAVQNIERFLRGESPHDLVDLISYDRAT
ncbi:MAG: hydroxyacid dehydrogenase [Puniceicoccales bacterium]